jgi:epoxyqueuosine reductase
MILMIKEISNYAKDLGFDMVSVIPADQLENDAGYFNDWLSKGFEGDMKYMEKDPEKRTDPQEILPGAQSIICLGMNYYQDSNAENFKVARYAFGKDYHKVIEKKLKKLRQFIIEKTGASKQDFKLYSDAGPILERAYAVKAGFGFIGKNTTLITQDFGSWVFLAEIITTLNIQRTFSEKVLFQKNCGSCDRCIKACPTGALKEPYVLDARKCISYQTIENKEQITVDTKDRVFGCDICQEVCPHNCRAQKTKIKEFTDHIAGPNLNPQEIEQMSEEEFQQKFQGSPLKRAGLKNLKRNIKKCYDQLSK